MALDPTIPLQAKTPESNPLATLLQVGQYKQLQQSNRRLQMDTDANQAVGQAIQANTGQDGSVDIAGVQKALAGNSAAAYNLQSATGTNLAQQGQQLGNQGAQIGNDASKFALHKDYTNTMLQTAQGVLADKRITAPAGQYDPAQAADALSEAMAQAEAKGVPKAQALLAVAPFVNAVHQPGAVAAMLQNSLRGQMGAPQQLAAATPNPTLTTDGATHTYRDTNPLTNPGIVGTSFTQKLGPDQLQAVGQDPNGNPTVTTKDQGGRVTGVAGAPVQGQPAVQPRVIPSSETPQSYAALQSSRDQANAAAAQAPQQHFNNRAIIDILDKDHVVNPTGANATWIKNVSSTIGLPVSGKFAEDANQIGHYLAMQKQANEKAMGVSTDAGRGTSEAVSGSTAMDPVSLRKAVAINDASTRGLATYNEGQEAAVKAGGIPAIRQFQNAWSKYYDVNAMRLLNADKNGDQKEAKDVIDSLGGPKSAKFQTMRTNAMMLDQLKHGIIPNGGQ